MEKVFKKIVNWSVIACIAIIALPVCALILLGVEKYVVMAIFCAFVVISLAKIYALAKKLAKLYQKMLEDEKKKQKKITTLLDIYGVLGIPPQYNQDGTIKDVYQLLKIEPVYDENGNRMFTIYELLGINPKFKKDGEEIPYVVCIKNRINALVKLDKKPRPLIYVPRKREGELDIRKIPTETTEKPKTTSNPNLGKVIKTETKTTGKKPEPKKGEKLFYGKAGKGFDAKVGAIGEVAKSDLFKLSMGKSNDKAEEFSSKGVNSAGQNAQTTGSHSNSSPNEDTSKKPTPQQNNSQQRSVFTSGPQIHEAVASGAELENSKKLPDAETQGTELKEQTRITAQVTVVSIQTQTAKIHKKTGSTSDSNYGGYFGL